MFGAKAPTPKSTGLKTGHYTRNTARPFETQGKPFEAQGKLKPCPDLPQILKAFVILVVELLLCCCHFFLFVFGQFFQLP